MVAAQAHWCDTLGDTQAFLTWGIMTKDAIIGSERRVSEMLMSYWNKLKGDRPVPEERELDIQEIEEFWDSCFMIEITYRGDECDYKYSYLGPSIVDAYGDDLTGKEVYNHLIAPYTTMLIAKFEVVVEDLQPVQDESEFVNLKGELVRYRQCLVPLGGVDGNIGFIMGSMMWKKYDLTSDD